MLIKLLRRFLKLKSVKSTEKSELFDDKAPTLWQALIHIGAMSGVEVVGLVLGALPLAVSAMEHYQDTRTVAGNFWRIKRAYRKDFRNVTHCRTIFALHVEELLQPLAKVDIDGDENVCAELLKDPGGRLWKSGDVETALGTRLRNQYQPYIDTMEELQTLMAKLAKETRVEDPQFQRLLAVRTASTAQTQLMQRANFLLKDAGFQAKRLKYSLTGGSREYLLKEVETYIRRLKDLLAAVDRISKASLEESTVRVSPVPKLLLHFWRHAERIHRLLLRSMHCKCRSMHCAKLWLRSHTESQASLGLLLLFTKSHLSTSSPWVAEGIRIRHVEDRLIPTISLSSSSQAVPHVVVQTASANKVTLSPSGLASSSKTSKVSFSTPTSPATSTSPLDLSNEGMCKALASGAKSRVCLGALVDEPEQVQYHVFPERLSDGGPTEIVTGSELLQPGGVPGLSFYRAYRYGVALRLAAAQLQFHSTQWFCGSWTLDEIRFPQKPIAPGGVDYSAPYLLTDFESRTTGKLAVTTTRDQSFWTLGVVLLELCFGMLLENHRSFANPQFPRNPKDPLQRQAVAYEWAQEVELEAGADYACAVNWCLQQSPISTFDVDWRKDFAQNVLQPLQRCCEPMKSAMNQP